jgi:hypothetical protein
MSRLIALGALASWLIVAPACSSSSDPEQTGGKADDPYAADAGSADAAPCVATLAESTDDTAAKDYDRLLAAATTLDFPFARVDGFELTGCVDITLDPEAPAAVAEAIVKFAYPDADDDLRAALEIKPFEQGGSRYLELMDMTKQVIVERTNDGNWDPLTSPDGPLFGQLDALFDSMTATVKASPLRFREVPMHLEADECSEELAGLVDTETGHLRLVHILPRC